MKVCLEMIHALHVFFSHTNSRSDDSSTHRPSTSMEVSPVSTIMAHPVAPSQTILSMYGGNTLC
jgi:hypothetical protein